MANTELGTPQKIGEINRKLILDYVRKHGPISRAELHRSLNMSAPTVSANVKRMLEGGYLLEAGDGDNSIGRKATLLRFNAQHGYVIGVDIGRSQMRVVLADLDGSEVAYLKEDSPAADSDADVILRKLCDMMARAVRDAKLGANNICCICIGLPGVPDTASGMLHAAPFIHAPELGKIESILKAAYPRARILLENSVNYGAVGEKWKGVASNYKNIAYIDYGVGIGAALILNGELYRGTNGAAGEMGFSVPESRFMRERYEAQGVLESIISGKRVGDILRERNGGAAEFENITAEQALSDHTIRMIVDYMGIALINITALFNEEIIVLGGRFGEFLGTRFIPIWKRMLAQHVPFVPEICVSALGARADVTGAVAVAIRVANDEIILSAADAE